MFLNIAQRRQPKIKQTDISCLSLCHFISSFFLFIISFLLISPQIIYQIFQSLSKFFQLILLFLHFSRHLLIVGMRIFCQFLTLSPISHPILAAIYYFSRGRQPYFYIRQKGVNIRFCVSNCACIHSR